MNPENILNLQERSKLIRAECQAFRDECEKLRRESQILLETTGTVIDEAMINIEEAIANKAESIAILQLACDGKSIAECISLREDEKNTREMLKDLSQQERSRENMQLEELHHKLMNLTFLPRSL